MGSDTDVLLAATVGDRDMMRGMAAAGANMEDIPTQAHASNPIINSTRWVEIRRIISLRFGGALFMDEVGGTRGEGKL
jgi:hypothetical protein